MKAPFRGSRLGFDFGKNCFPADRVQDFGILTNSKGYRFKATSLAEWYHLDQVTWSVQNGESNVDKNYGNISVRSPTSFPGRLLTVLKGEQTENPH